MNSSPGVFINTTVDDHKRGTCRVATRHDHKKAQNYKLRASIRVRAVPRTPNPEPELVNDGNPNPRDTEQPLPEWNPENQQTRNSRQTFTNGNCLAASSVLHTGIFVA